MSRCFSLARCSVSAARQRAAPLMSPAKSYPSLGRPLLFQFCCHKKDFGTASSGLTSIAEKSSSGSPEKIEAEIPIHPLPKDLEDFELPEGFQFVRVVRDGGLDRVTRWFSEEHGLFDISDNAMVRESMAFKVKDGESLKTQGNWGDVLAQVDGVLKTREVLLQMAEFETDGEKEDARLLKRIKSEASFIKTEIPEIRRSFFVPKGIRFHSAPRHSVTRWETNLHGLVDISCNYMVRETMAFKVKPEAVSKKISDGGVWDGVICSRDGPDETQMVLGMLTEKEEELD